MILSPMMCEICHTPWYSVDRPCAHVAAIYREQARRERRRVRFAVIAAICFAMVGVLACIAVLLAGRP